MWFFSNVQCTKENIEGKYFVFLLLIFLLQRVRSIINQHTNKKNANSAMVHYELSHE